MLIRIIMPKWLMALGKGMGIEMAKDQYNREVAQSGKMGLPEGSPEEEALETPSEEAAEMTPQSHHEAQAGFHDQHAVFHDTHSKTHAKHADHHRAQAMHHRKMAAHHGGY